MIIAAYIENSSKIRIQLKYREMLFAHDIQYGCASCFEDEDQVKSYEMLEFVASLVTSAVKSEPESLKRKNKVVKSAPITQMPYVRLHNQWPILSTWINFNPSMDK